MRQFVRKMAFWKYFLLNVDIKNELLLELYVDRIPRVANAMLRFYNITE